MANYLYKVRSKSGQVSTGIQIADNERQLIDKLKKLGFFILSIEEHKAGLSGLSFNSEINLDGFMAKIFGGSGVNQKELIIAVRQLAIMADTGITLIDSLNELAAQAENPALRTIWKSLRDRVEAGGTLSSALAEHPKVFEPLFVNMVKAGETGGILVSVLGNLAAFMEERFEREAKIKAALTYPVIMAIVALIIVSVLLVFVIPIFADMFAESGQSLPWLTQTLMDVSSFAVHNIIWITLGIVTLIVSFLQMAKTKWGIYFIDKMKLRLPFIGNLIHKSVLSRFSRTLGVMIESGVPILESFDIVEAVAGNVIVQDAIHEAKEKVTEGVPINKALQPHKHIFPAMVIRMVATGEETGAIEVVLNKVADFYDTEVEYATEAMMSAIEPALIIFMGVVIGGMVAALMLPIFEMGTIAG